MNPALQALSLVIFWLLKRTKYIISYCGVEALLVFISLENSGAYI